MHRSTSTLANTLALLAVTAAAATAQVTPSPAASTPPSPAATAPAEPSIAPSDSASPAASPAAAATPEIEGHVKTLRKGTLTPGQLAYAVSHPAQEAAKLRAMHTVHFDNLRVYRVAPGILPKLHVSNQEVAYEPLTMLDGGGSQTVALNLTQPLLNIIANINVQDALNNALNGNTVTVSLQNVLNNNKIAIGQLVGVYVGGGGIITTIIH